MMERFREYICTSLIIFLVSAFTFSYVGKRVPGDKPRYGGVFRLKSFTNKFRMQLDPASPDSFIFISEQIYDGLVRLDKNLNIVPSLAEYWEISADGMIYKFYLRKGVKFHHGRELSANDVKFSLERILDRKTNYPYYQFFVTRVVGAKDFREGKRDNVAGFKVLDKYTFEIHWTKPFVSALYLMSMYFCKILPRDIVLDKGKSFFLKPSGTGPFVFKYWVRTPRLEPVGVHLERNNEYFGGKPYLKVLEFCPLYTLGHFINGEIHSIPVLSDKLLESNYQIFQDGSIHPVFLGMSCHIPPLDNPIVRRAISYCIDKRKVIHAARDFRYVSEVMNSYIPSRLPGFFPSEDEKTYDLDRAKQLLQKAGFFSEKEFPFLTLFLDLPRAEVKVRIQRELKKQLDALGIKLRLKFYESFAEIKRFKNPYLILQGKLMDFPDPENIIRPLFFSKSIFNLFGYANPKLDKLLQEAEVERSWTRRIKLFHRIERILFSDVPAVPLFSRQNQIAMQPYVRGVEVPPLGLYYLEAKKIWLDK